MTWTPGPARVVVVAGDVALHDLAKDRGHAAPLPSRTPWRRGVGLFLDREVEVTAGADRPMEVVKDERPVLGWHVLHRVDSHRGVEGLLERELLQAHVGEALGDAPSLRDGQHPGGLVDADDAPAGGRHDREVAAGAARGVQDDTARRTRFGEPADEPGLDLGGVLLVVVGGGVVLVVREHTRAPLGKPGAAGLIHRRRIPGPALRRPLAWIARLGPSGSVTHRASRATMGRRLAPQPEHPATRNPMPTLAQRRRSFRVAASAIALAVACLLALVSATLAASPHRLAGPITDDVDAIGGRTAEVQGSLDALQDATGTQLWVWYTGTLDGADSGDVRDRDGQ